MIFDIHTHDISARNALISVNPAEFDPQPGTFYSVGIHPWRLSASDEDMKLLESIVSREDVLMIGECGIDKVRGVELNEQIKVLRKHVELSETLGKPLILHCVKASNELVALRKEIRATQPWVVHGFRGNANVARQLLAAGMFLSFGEHFNADALKVVPPGRLLVETDESAMKIDEIAKRVAETRGVPCEELESDVLQTIQVLLHRMLRITDMNLKKS